MSFKVRSRISISNARKHLIKCSSPHPSCFFSMQYWNFSLLVFLEPIILCSYWRSWTWASFQRFNWVFLKSGNVCNWIFRFYSFSKIRLPHPLRRIASVDKCWNANVALHTKVLNVLKVPNFANPLLMKVLIPWITPLKTSCTTLFWEENEG